MSCLDNSIKLISVESKDNQQLFILPEIKIKDLELFTVEDVLKE